MDVATVVETIGSRGKYHIILGTLLAISLMNLAVNNLAPVAHGYLPPHRCLNIGDRHPKDVSRNATDNNTWAKYGHSSRTKYGNFSRTGNGNFSRTGNGNFSRTKYGNLSWTEYGRCFEVKHHNASVTKVPCPNGWSFDLEKRQSTIMNEFSLVCDKQYLGMLSVSIYFVGVMIGVTICGMLADRFGRRKIIMVTITGQIIAGTAVAFSPNYASYVALRFLLGLFMEGYSCTSFVMLMEMMPSRVRARFAGLYEISWAIGSVYMACVSWAVKDWRKIQLIFSLVSLYAIAYVWILPESIRWSATKGRIKEAILHAARIAKFNKIELPEDFTITSTALEKEYQKNGGESLIRRILNVMTTMKVIRKRAICMIYIWMTCSFLYYGISLNVINLSGNVYKNLFIMSIIEIPAVLIAIALFLRIGRRLPLIVYFFGASLACIISGCLPKTTHDGTDLQTYATVLAFVGKFFVSAAFSNVAIFTSELFPTPVRNTLSGCCALGSRIGSVIAPQILVLGLYTTRELPFVFIGSISLIASFAVWLLPETKGKMLPNTIEDVENENTKVEFDLGGSDSAIEAKL